jgi:predicted ribosome quality control (RQC) complex YloA/Tae2 family protein
MPFDNFVTGAIARELDGALAGGKVERVYQPERYEILLHINVPPGAALEKSGGAAGCTTGVVAEAAPDESTTGVVSEAAPDGSTTGIVAEAAPDGSTTGIVSETVPDGSTTGIVSETVLDGSTTGIVSETVLDGSTTGIVSETVPPGGSVSRAGAVGRSHPALLISAQGSHPYIYISERKSANPQSPPAFCMLLRKHLIGARVSRVFRVGCERILRIEFNASDELGVRSRKTLLFEIMGKHSNLMLLDENDTVLDSIKRVYADMSRVRQTLPGIAYTPPPPGKGIGPLMAAENETGKPLTYYERLEEDGLYEPKIIYDDTGAMKDFYVFSLDAYSAFSSTACSSVSAMIETYYEEKETDNRMAQKSADLRQIIKNDLDKLYLKKQRLLEDVEKAKRADEFRRKGELLTSNIYKLSRGMKEAEVEDYSAETVFGNRDAETISTNHDGKTISANHGGETISANHGEETISENHDEETISANHGGKTISTNHDGETISANHGRETISANHDGKTISANHDGGRRQMPENQSNSDVQSSADGAARIPVVKIALDPLLSPAQNAQKYFKKYAKAKTALTEKAKQLDITERDISFLESYKVFIENAEDTDDIDGLREELTELGYVRRRGGKKAKRSVKKQYLRYESESGLTIYVGRNNRENDELTLKKAKSGDLWLHTKDIPGSHVILVKRPGAHPPGKKPNAKDAGEAQPAEGPQGFDDASIRKAAQIAAYYSKAKQSESVPVDYCLVKYVKKPAGAKPGMVIFTHNKTLYVKPANA